MKKKQLKAGLKNSVDSDEKTWLFSSLYGVFDAVMEVLICKLFIRAARKLQFSISFYTSDAAINLLIPYFSRH